jgi:hypothetical protein
MKIFEGKSPTEKKKIIAAIALGVLAVLALGYTFGGSLFGSKTKVSVSVSPSPSPSAAKTTDARPATSLPTQDEADFVYQTTEVVYNPGMFYAPDAGRNIFAFYEPPPKTPPIITPPVETPMKTPPPTPVPPQLISYITPQSVFAGQKGFLLEVNGEKFTADTRIIFNGGEIPTTYVSPQRLTSNIPSNFIASEGVRTIMARTPDGKFYSNQMMMNVQAPPTPQFQYIGAKLTARANNNTAYFQEQGKEKPFSARLNDLVAGRFKLISISSIEVVFEDVNLGFRHRLALYRPAAGQITSTRNDNPTFQNQPYPTTPIYNTEIPGIPNNIPRYNPNNTNTAPLNNPQKQQQKQLDDEDDDGPN